MSPFCFEGLCFLECLAHNSEFWAARKMKSFQRNVAVTIRSWLHFHKHPVGTVNLRSLWKKCQLPLSFYFTQCHDILPWLTFISFSIDPTLESAFTQFKQITKDNMIIWQNCLTLTCLPFEVKSPLLSSDYLSRLHVMFYWFCSLFLVWTFQCILMRGEIDLLMTWIIININISWLCDYWEDVQ